MEDIKKLFNGFVKVCDALKKITTEPIIASDGVFFWMVEGSLAVATFKEKVEKDIMPFLSGKYDLNYVAVLFMTKYFQIDDIEFQPDGIRLVFTGILSNDALADKAIETVIQMIEKQPDGRLALTLKYLDPDDSELYQQVSTIIQKVYQTADYDKSVMIDDLDKTALLKSDLPLSIEVDGFKVRIAKSVFQSIATADSITMRLTPYKDTGSIFLCTATVSKDLCQVINVFNALYV